MKRRYHFKNGQVTEETRLYSLLTEMPRESSGAVVLLTAQSAPQGEERGSRDETAAEA